MAGPIIVSRRIRRVGAGRPPTVVRRPECPSRPGGLSDRPERLRRRRAQLQRRGRGHRPVCGPMAPAPAVGLHEEDRRGCGRRLAPHLRRAAPVLRAHRPAVRGLGPRGRPGLPRRRRSPTAPASHRTRCAQGRPGPRPARLALVAGGQRDPVRTMVGPAPVRPTGHVSPRVQRGSQGLHRSDALARLRGGRGAAHHRCLRRGAPDRCAWARHRRRMGGRGGRGALPGG